MFQRRVADSCQAVLLGVEDVESQGAIRSGRFWYGIQNLVVGAANASKALWGAGKAEDRRRRYRDRQPLRDSLSVTDASPLRQIKIRNDYEHLDERIEEWWKTSANHNVVSELIGPRGSVGGDALGDKDTLRWFDPTTGNLIFWGNELNVPSVAEEARRIFPLAEAESLKPHWEP
jgi:hypothetical protein